LGTLAVGVAILLVVCLWILLGVRLFFARRKPVVSTKASPTNSRGVRFLDTLSHTAHQVEREDLLINHRISWSLALQGFLFLSSATVLASQHIEADEQDALIAAFGVIGSLVAIFTVLAVYAALSSIRRLKLDWQRISAEFGDEYRWFSQPYGDEAQHRASLLIAYGLPGAIGFGWISIMTIGFFRGR
jgi:hypothetical protein